MSQILIWSPNYAPELTGIPPLVTDAAEWLAAHGHAVEVVTAVPNYPERVIRREYRQRRRRTERFGSVVVRRSWLRVRPEERFLDKAMYELTFTMFSLPNALRAMRRANVVVCVVPCLSAALASAALTRIRRAIGRRPRLVLWIQDLVLRAALSLEDVGPAARGVLALAGTAESLAASSADRVVCCSPAFASYLSGIGVDERRVETIYNWVDLGRISPRPEPSASATRFVYTGNLGYTQGFETLLEAARLAGSGITVDIVGAGNAAEHVRRLAVSLPNVRVRGPVRDDAYPDVLASAHAHIVLQRRISANANFPSKIPSYLASGRPIVASIAPASAAADVLEASGGALLVPPEQPVELAEAMMRLAGNPALRAELGLRGRRYAERFFGRDPALTRLEQAFVG